MKKQAIFNLLCLISIFLSVVLLAISTRQSAQLATVYSAMDELNQRSDSLSAQLATVYSAMDELNQRSDSLSALLSNSDTLDLGAALAFVHSDMKDTIPNTPFEREVTARINSLISWRTAINHFVDETCDRNGWDIADVRDSVRHRMELAGVNPQNLGNE